VDVVLEDFLDVDLGRFWLETGNVLECVFLTADAVVLRDFVMNEVSWGLSSRQWLLVDSKMSLIPLSCVLITVDKNHISPVDMDLVTYHEIIRSVELLLLQ